MSYIYSDNFDLLDTFQDYKMDFTTISTNYSVRVKSDLGNYIIADEELSYKTLSFMQRIKKDIKSKAYKAPDQCLVRYYRYSDRLRNFKIENKRKKIYEIDLNSAYWNAAHKLGYLNEELFIEGLDVPKKIRLKALGAIAVKKVIQEYKKGVLTGEPVIEQDKELLAVWLHIVSEISELLEKAAEYAITNNDFLFYWTDAILCTEKSKDIIMASFKEAGYSFKLREIEKFEIIEQGYQNKLTTYMTPVIIIYEKNTTPRPFPVLDNKIKFAKFA